MPVGTHPYIALEMVRGAPFGTGADVWSMGLVLAEVLGVYRGPRFRARSVEEAAEEHKQVAALDKEHLSEAKLDLEFQLILLNVRRCLC